MNLVLYTRPTGVVSFAVALLDPAHLDEVIQDLFATRLTWSWLSVLRSVSNPDNTSMGAADRRLTWLTLENHNHLVTDALERDPDGFGRVLVILGCVPTGDVSFHGPEQLRSELEHFILDRPSAVKIVIVQPGDSPVDYVFVSPSRGQTVSRLLETWGLTELKATEVRAYQKLGVVQLELQVNSIARHAFSGCA